MQRREATQLFKEICECMPDAVISNILLTPIDRLKEEFALRIDAHLNANSLENVKAIVGKHGLTLKEDRGSLLIYESETKRTSMKILA